MAWPRRGAESLGAAVLLRAGQRVALPFKADLAVVLRIRVHGGGHLPAVSSVRVSPECRNAQRCRPWPASSSSAVGGIASTGQRAPGQTVTADLPAGHAADGAVPSGPDDEQVPRAAGLADEDGSGLRHESPGARRAHRRAARRTPHPGPRPGACWRRPPRRAAGNPMGAAGPRRHRRAGPRPDGDERGVLAARQYGCVAQGLQVPRGPAHAGDDTAESGHVSSPFGCRW